MSSQWFVIPQLSRRAPAKGPGSLPSKSSTRVPEAPQLLPRCDFEQFQEVNAVVESSHDEIAAYPGNGTEAVFASRTLRTAFNVIEGLNAAFPEESSYNEIGETGGKDRRKKTIKEHRTGTIPFNIAETAHHLLVACAEGKSTMFQINNDAAKHVVQTISIQDRVDLSLSSGHYADSGDQSSAPVYSPEPAADAQGVLTQPGAISSSRQAIERIRSRHIAPDVQFWRKEMIEDGYPLGVVELKRPALDIQSLLSGEDVPAMIGSMVSRMPKNGTPSPILLALAQGILYCLHTESRTTLLTDLNAVMILQANFQEMEQKADSVRLKVKASRVFGNDKILAGYIGYFRYLLTCVDETPDWDFNARFVNSIRACSPNPRRIATSQQNHTLVSEETPVLLQSREESVLGLKSRTERGASSNFEGAGGIFSMLLESEFTSLEYSPVISCDLLYGLIDTGVSCFESSENFIVLRSTLQGTSVVVKFARFIGDKYSNELLNNELIMHQILYTNTGGRYGEFVSRLLGYGVVPEYGLVLVTEFVGYNVDCDNNVTLVNGEAVMDVSKLMKAALRSLGILHSHGMLHGDVAFRNMRASRRRGSDWQVWWVDLGFGSTVATENPLEAEERDCNMLFLQPK